MVTSVKQPVIFTQQELQRSIIQEKDDGENEFYLVDSMDNYLKFFDPQNILASRLQAKNSINQHKFTDHNNENDSWAFDRDKTRTNYLERLNTWTPYPEVLEEIERQKTQFLSDPRVKEAFKRLVTYKKNKKFTVDDGELVFERVMAGDPEYYQKTVKRAKKKGIRILLNFSQNCGQDYHTFAANTVDMFKIAYVFELMGMPVQILAGFVPQCASSGKQFTGVLFLLKSETEQINLQKSALISCPGLLRYHAFAADGLLLKGQIYSGHGTTTSVSKKFIELAELDFLVGQENKGDKVIAELLKIVEK